jgi:hypothetical protein
MLRTIEARRILTITAALAAIATPAGIQAQETAGQDSEGGLFAGIGLGMGVMDCFNSYGCYKVLAGNLRFGSRLSPHVAIAVGVEAFGAEDVGAALLSAQVLYYPTGGDMFALLGAGAAFANWNSPGAGLTLGIGYDIPLNKGATVALTPYAGVVLTTVDDPDWQFMYAGLSITWK